MRTIGRHWPLRAPRGDYARLCDYCGAKWRFSQLRQNAAGLYACGPCDGDRHFARPAHVLNNFGTGGTNPDAGQQSDPFPVIL